PLVPHPAQAVADGALGHLLRVRHRRARRLVRRALAGRQRHLDRGGAMSWGAIFGVVALNAGFLAVGVAVLFALRGWRSWGELLRLSGLAYMLGVSSTATVLVWILIVSIPFSVATVLVAGALVGVVAVAAGVRLGRQLPSRPHVRI